MKNRLETAKELLISDGFFFIQIDDYQLGYLKVLCDEVFNRENAVNIIAVKMSETSGVKMAHVDKKLPKIKEFILSYRKNNTSRLNPIKNKVLQGSKLDDYLKYYKKVIENYNDPVEQWIITSIKDYLKKQGLEADEQSVKNFQLENAEKGWFTEQITNLLRNSNLKGKIALVKSKQGLDYVWWEGKQMLFLADYIDEYICDFWTDISTINLNKEGGVDLANGKKPEKLLKANNSTYQKKGILLRLSLR